MDIDIHHRYIYNTYACVSMLFYNAILYYDLLLEFHNGQEQALARPAVKTPTQLG